jgi:hypothetical protein
MRTARAGWLLWLGACLALGGCISKQGRLDVASIAPGAEALVGRAWARAPMQREVVGRDTRVTSVLFFPTFDGPRLERALEDALAGVAGDSLRGVRVRTTEFWLLVGWSVLEVRGDVTQLGAPEEAP